MAALAERMRVPRATAIQLLKEAADETSEGARNRIRSINTGIDDGNDNSSSNEILLRGRGSIG